MFVDTALIDVAVLMSRFFTHAPFLPSTKGQPAAGGMAYLSWKEKKRA